MLIRCFELTPKSLRKDFLTPLGNENKVFYGEKTFPAIRILPGQMRQFQKLASTYTWNRFRGKKERRVMLEHILPQMAEGPLKNSVPETLNRIGKLLWHFRIKKKTYFSCVSKHCVFVLWTVLHQAWHILILGSTFTIQGKLRQDLYYILSTKNQEDRAVAAECTSR